MKIALDAMGGDFGPPNLVGGAVLALREYPQIDRLFLVGEVAFQSSKHAPAQHLAVRLAAKEAAYKALSGNELARGIGWRDVEVLSREDGAPELRLHGRAAERFVELGGETIHVSLTHSAMTAIAVVIIER